MKPWLCLDCGCIHAGVTKTENEVSVYCYKKFRNVVKYTMTCPDFQGKTLRDFKGFEKTIEYFDRWELDNG